VERTSAQFAGALRGFPRARWRDSPAGQANSLAGILQHLLDCEPWWSVNIGVPVGERPARVEVSRCQSVAAAMRAFGAARNGLLSRLRELPDSFFETRPATCHYGGLQSGAELCLYIAEHDFYHQGQIAMLGMALTSEG